MLLERKKISAHSIVPSINPQNKFIRIIQFLGVLKIVVIIILKVFEPLCPWFYRFEGTFIIETENTQIIILI